MKTRHLWLLILLVAGVLPASPSRAQEPWGAPFTGTEPPGWSWWCGDTMCILLPDEGPGPQRRFLIAARGAGIDGLEAGWLGGGEVVWEGVVRTAAGACRGRIATTGETRGFIGAADAWNVAAVAPQAAWEATAPVFNAVLRGQP